MSSKKETSPAGSFFLVFFFGVLLIILLNVLSVFPTQEKVNDFLKKAQIISRLVPDEQGIIDYSKRLMMQASESAQGYNSAYDLLFKEPSKAFKILFSAFIAEYLLLGGALLGILSMQAFLIILVLLLILGIFLYKKRGLIEDMSIRWRAKKLSPIKDEKIEYILGLFLKNPVPASIFHHSAVEGGLLKHSLNVARLSAKLAKEKGLNPKTAFLMGLLHDIGKLKIYRKVPAEESAPAPSPLGSKRKNKNKQKRYRWESLHVNQEVVNKLFIKELTEKLSLRLPQDPAYWEVVKTADRIQTEKEMREGVFGIKELFLPAIKNLPEKTYWKKGDYFVVLAHAFCRTLTELMLEQDKGLNISPEPDRAGVHVIAYSVYKELPLIKQIGKLKADDLGLFDVMVGNNLFKAVYVFPSSFAQNIPETEEEISFVERTQA